MRRRPPWLAGALVVAIVLLIATGGSRGWWARRVGDVTGKSHLGDFAIGLGVGLIPVIAVGAAALIKRGGRRRVLRMFVAGAAGFIVTDLLAPSLWTAIRNDSATRPFEQHAPGYLPGVYVGVAVWIALLVVAYVRARRAWRARFRRYP